MPVIKSARKAQRQTQKRTERNLSKKNILKSEIKKAKDKKNPGALSRLYSLIDKAARGGIIHKNKAGRIKSKLAGLLASQKR